jgi:oligoribonuclease NrnB/cAMP/cGMP phosphodiesterase (DHH superfamily)
MFDKTWKPTSKTALVTHKGCLDGTGSALMFIWAGGLRENIFFRNPSFCFLTPQEAAPFDEVWFADVCPVSLEDPAGGKHFHVFDHHISNQKKFWDDPRCTFDMSKSGTSLMAHFLNVLEDGVRLYSYEQDLVHALESYDLGKFDCAAGVRLADIATSFSQEEMLDLMLEREPEGILHDSDLSSRAESAASTRNEYAERAASSAYGFMFDERIACGVAVSPVYWKNEVAQRILKQYDLAMVIDPTAQMVSLRSKEGGPDCSIIAARYGGGGHARAAGFKANGPYMLSALVEAVIG